MIIGYCATILFLSVTAINGSFSLNKSKTFGLRTDYLLHVLLFIPWMVLVQWRWGKDGKRIKWFWISLGAGLIIAGVSALVQLLLPYRTFNIFDFMANSLGIVIGALISGWGWRSARR